MQVLRQLPLTRDRRVLVGSAAADDAGVYRLDRSRALVQTVDFFTPIVDDPFQYGEIAAANALSDIFAMGGRPMTALNIVGMPTEEISGKIIATILRGGLSKAREVDCAIIGGHTIRSPEPLYGLAVTGMVDLRHIMTNAKARPGDLLLLTKPLGTGIVTTAIKRSLVSRSLEKKTIAVMSRINTIGAHLAKRGLVRAATDVTGFGLLGHLASMCRASGVSAEILADRVPAIDNQVFELIARGCIPGGSRDNLKIANKIADWKRTPQSRRVLLTDAQTSGGLLLSVAPSRLNKVLALLKRHRTACAAIIGRIVSAREPLLCINE